MTRKIVCVFFCFVLCCPILAQELAEPASPKDGKSNKDRKPKPSKVYRGLREKAKLPPGIFGVEKSPPDAARTVLGESVPALWEIERSTPDMDDENFSDLLERNTIAPPVPGKVLRYATRLTQLYDTNADGVLQEEEWKKMPGAPQAMDIDGDHEISLEEMLRFLAIYGQDRTIHHPQPVARYYEPKMISSQFQLFKPIAPPPVEPPKQEEPVASAEPAEKDLTETGMEDDETPIDDATYEEIASSRQVSTVKKYTTAPETLRGVPAWFLLRDRDGDGQVSLKEFAPQLSVSALALFGRLDKNGDGFITPDEVRTPPASENNAP